MARVVTVFLLLLMLVPTFLLPAKINAYNCPSTSSIILETLPVTQITPTTAVFNGRSFQTLRLKFPGQNQNNITVNNWAFDYGTRSGVYPHRVTATIGEQIFDNGRDNGYFWLQLRFPLTATVQNLDPCDTYYVRLVYLGSLAGLVADPCSTITMPTEVKFETTGCMIRTLGQGGSAPGTAGTTSSSLPTSAPVQMASVIVQGATIATTKVSMGQDVDIAATVTNKGTANGDAKLTLYVNGEAVESKGVTVAAGQTAPVHFNVNRNDPGTYEVYVNGTPAGSFTVDVFTNNDSLIYIIMALFVMGIAGTVYLIMRKKAV